MVDFSTEAEKQTAAQNSNGQQTMAQAPDQTPAPVPSQAAGAAAAAQAGAQQAAAATAAQQAAAVAAQQAAAAAVGQAAGQPPAKNPVSVWGRLPENENYIKFTAENAFRQRIQFIDEEPTEKPSKFKPEKMDYEFEVVDLLAPERAVKIWNVSSIKLMNQLAVYLPIGGKIFDVQRVGEGLQIEYILTPVIQ